MSHAEDEVAPLGDGARRFVDAARPHERLSPERKALLRGRVMAAVAAGAGASIVAGAAKAAEVSSSAASAAGSSAVSGGAIAGGAVKAAGISLFAKIGVGVAVVTIGAGSLLWSRAHEGSGQGNLAPSASASVAFFEDDDTSAAALAAESTSAAAPSDTGAPGDTGFPSAGAIADDARGGLNERPAATSAPTASGALSGAPSASGSASGSASAELGDTLQEEMKLLAAAHTALSQGNAGLALSLLDQHAAKFPRGTMAPERRATRVMALCKAGRTDEGLREIHALYGADSKSPMAQKLARACGQ